MSIYLAKFRPLNSTSAGEHASRRLGIPPYVDGSCRREPDLELKCPSISALCRGALFVPNLRIGDQVIYMTAKGEYGEGFRHWRLVARLRLTRQFENHAVAGQWYRAYSGRLPSNCMIPENPPLPLDHTYDDGGSGCVAGCRSGAGRLEDWDARYWERARRWPMFFACECIWKELVRPAILRDQDALRILGTTVRVNSRLPIRITESELQQLEGMRTSPP